MLTFKPLTLDDKDLFDSYLHPYNFLTCEYSFTNLFIWRKACDTSFALHDGVLILKKKDLNNGYYFMQPLGYNKENLKTVIDMLIDYSKENNMEYTFKDLEAPFIEELQELYGDSFCINEDIDNFDYIYESKKLISLSGKKLHSKRNHYNNFVKNNTYTVSPIRGEVIKDCIQAAREWCCKNDCEGYLLYELMAIEEMLRHRCSLAFKGIVVYVNDKPAAFTIGEKVNDNMAIIHIEKADNTINGLYAFINKTFVETCFSDVPFINREEDMGIEGLRKAKHSYYPVRLEHKYYAKFVK
jgi:uncharacterized protein